MAYLEREQGQDPELLEARERMPEPSRWPDFYLKVCVGRPPPCAFWVSPSIKQAIDHRRVALFEKARVRTGIGHTEFEVWKHSESGKLYI